MLKQFLSKGRTTTHHTKKCLTTTTQIRPFTHNINNANNKNNNKINPTTTTINNPTITLNHNKPPTPLFSHHHPLNKYFSTTSTITHQQQQKTVEHQNSQTSTPSTVLLPSPKYKSGDVIEGWTVIKVDQVPSFHINTYQLVHQKTGARYFHVESPSDSNNSFSISFQTPPNDSTGAPHILEHTTLCGSEKFPVQDLFFNMYKRSMNTYMNAYTASDHTTYPYATLNEQDYYNLMSVYLDATLFPRLLETDFKQEGHRLEFDVPNDMASELRIKGVVYNEMKGAMSDPSQYFMRSVQAAVLPDTIYAHNSGGEPRDIPDITYEQLKRFHETHYHPTRAYVYTYGNLPMERHIRYMNEHAFDRFERLEQSVMERQDAQVRYRVKPFTEPRRVQLYGPPDAMSADPSKQTKVAISYLTNDSIDTDETMAMSFLCSLLLDDFRGPFYKNIIDRGIAPDFAPGVGYSSSHRDTTFTVGFQGIKPESVPVVEQAIEQTFEMVARDGISDSLIQSAMHSFELALKKKSPNFGVELCYPIVSNWIHSQDPSTVLQINRQLDELKIKLADPDFLKNLTKKYFIGNQHKVTVVMNPDEKYGEKLKEYEQERLTEIQKTLTLEDKQEIVNSSLKVEQLKKELEKNKHLLPSLSLSDISRKIVDPVNVEQASNLPIHLSREVTNGIVYASIQVPLSLDAIPQDMHSVLPIFGGALVKMGARDMDSEKLIEQIELYTGGISASFCLVPSLDDVSKMTPMLKIYSMCLERNVEKMLDLIHAIFTEPKLDSNPDFLKKMIDQSAMEFQSSVVQSGNRFAKKYASSSLTQFDNWEDQFSGLRGLHYLNMLSSLEDVSFVADQLQQMKNHLLVKQDMKILFTSENEFVPKASWAFEKFYESIPFSTQPSIPENSQSIEFKPSSQKTYIKLPSSVNFVAQSMIAAPFSNPDSVKLRIASNLINSLYLHQEIREKGGAYGSSANESMNGVFSFTSYRDPNAMRTVNIFDNVCDWVNQKKFTDLELQEAKLQVFQGLDAPSSPHARAASLFTNGISDEMRQQRRDAVFATTATDIQDVCNKYLSKDNPLKSTAILGVDNEVPEEIQNSTEWHITD